MISIDNITTHIYEPACRAVDAVSDDDFCYYTRHVHSLLIVGTSASQNGTLWIMAALINRLEETTWDSRCGSKPGQSTLDVNTAYLARGRIACHSRANGLFPHHTSRCIHRRQCRNLAMLTRAC